ncbi:MAG: hypothetical protein JW727_04100 [Candidatus Aenigmarchaeota archaeon]|nr:hypothetical protein [Candidatus Aenigmarchaeota archaeon]
MRDYRDIANGIRIGCPTAVAKLREIVGRPDEEMNDCSRFAPEDTLGLSNALGLSGVFNIGADSHHTELLIGLSEQDGQYSLTVHSPYLGILSSTRDSLDESRFYLTRNISKEYLDWRTGKGGKAASLGDYLSGTYYPNHRLNPLTENVLSRVNQMIFAPNCAPAEIWTLWSVNKLEGGLEPEIGGFIDELALCRPRLKI